MNMFRARSGRFFARIVGVLFLSTQGLWAWGQYSQNASEPDFISRRELVSSPFRLIYRADRDSLALEAMRYLQLYEGASRMGGRARCLFPVNLRASTSVSNGSVGWIPARMELYGLTSGEASTPVPWLDHLVSHELRHRAQLIALQRHWTVGLQLLFGQQGIAIASIQTPVWFLEGDAIYNESRLSGYGRANMATTYQQYRMDLLTGNTLRYDQYLYRSLRYKVPNHYDFGSALVEYGVYRHGEKYWENVLEYVTKHPIYIVPFGIGMNKYGGESGKQNWESALKSMDSVFRASLHGPEDTVPQVRGEYASFRFPYALQEQGRSYFWRTTFHERQRLVERVEASGKERVLYEPHYRMGAPRYDSTLVAWVQLYQHPFWDDVNWGDIWVYDLVKRKGVRFTRKGHYLSPQPRAKGELLDAIEVGEKGQYRLVRLSLPTDSLVASYRFPEGWELREVVKGLTPSSVLVRAVNTEGTRLVEFDWQRGEHRVLLGPVRMDISGVQCAAEGVYFSMSNDYMRRAFLASWAGDGLAAPQELVLPSYGVEDLTPLPDGRVLYASLGINGYSIAEVGHAEHREVANFEQSGRLYPLPSEKERLSSYAEPLVADTSRMAAGPLVSERYDPVAGAFHFHSWLPFYPGGGISDLSKLSGFAPGITLLSENANGTFSMQAAYFYQWGYHGGEVVLKCNGVWPRWQFTGRMGGQPRVWQFPQGGGHGVNIREEGVYFSGNARLSFPVRWGSESLGYWLTPFATVDVDNSAHFNPVILRWYRYNLTTRVGLQAGFSRYMATRDIYPRWGLEFQGSARFYPVMGRYAAPVFETRGRVNVPGFWHSHVVRVGAHWMEQGQGMFEHVFYFPLRAKPFNAAANFTRGRGFFSLDADYTLPLGYPDWVWGGFMYIKRFYLTLFGQYARMERLNGPTTMHRLVGGELVVNLHPLRLQGEVELGARVACSPWGDALGGKYGWPVSVEGIVHVSPWPLGDVEEAPARLERLLP